MIKLSDIYKNGFVPDFPHIEKRDGEIHTTNTCKAEFDKYDLKTKRLGATAYDSMGNAIPKQEWKTELDRNEFETLPLFISKTELEGIGFKTREIHDLWVCTGPKRKGKIHSGNNHCEVKTALFIPCGGNGGA